MLSVRIKKRLGSFRLDLNLASEASCLGLLGASGCGKSLTLRCIAGIERPDEGRIVLNERVLFDSEQGIDVPPRLRRIGYLFQHYALFPTMTVRENLRVGEVSAAAADFWLRALRIEDLAERKPRSLSGGQQQRVALARLLAQGPDLILLDEPFSALDDYLKWQLELELRDALERSGRPAVLVTHSRDEIYRLCDQVAVLHNGHGEGALETALLFRHPRTVAAARLSGCKNLARMELRENQLAVPDWGLALDPGPRSDEARSCDAIGIRAHDLRLSPVDTNAAASGLRPLTAHKANAVIVRVARRLDNQFEWIYMLDTPGSKQLRAETSKNLGQVYDVGQVLRAELPTAALLLLHENEQPALD